jgi:hypothetical protein
VKKESNRISIKLYREDHTRLLKRGSVGDLVITQSLDMTGNIGKNYKFNILLLMIDKQ